MSSSDTEGFDETLSVFHRGLAQWQLAIHERQDDADAALDHQQQCRQPYQRLASDERIEH